MPFSAYVKAGLFVVAAAAALFAAAGTVAIPGFWAYLAIFAVVMIVSFATLDPDLLRERMRPGGKKPPLALRIFSLVLFIHWIVTSRTARQQSSGCRSSGCSTRARSDDLHQPRVRLRPSFSPINASSEQLKGLPQTLLLVDENDVLRDEGEAYGRKFRSGRFATMARSTTSCCSTRSRTRPRCVAPSIRRQIICARSSPALRCVNSVKLASSSR